MLYLSICLLEITDESKSSDLKLETVPSAPVYTNQTQWSREEMKVLVFLPYFSSMLIVFLLAHIIYVSRNVVQSVGLQYFFFALSTAL